MKTVNPFFLHTLLGPLVGLADDDEAVLRFASLNPNNEEQVKTVIRELLVPNYLTFSTEIRERARIALGHYLAKREADFGRVLESCLLPFEPPSDPRLFFRWMWDELFPNDHLDCQSMSEFREVPDIDEPNRLAAMAKRTQKSQ